MSGLVVSGLVVSGLVVSGLVVSGLVVSGLVVSVLVGRLCGWSVVWLVGCVVGRGCVVVAVVWWSRLCGGCGCVVVAVVWWLRLLFFFFKTASQVVTLRMRKQGQSTQARARC